MDALEPNKKLSYNVLRTGMPSYGFGPMKHTYTFHTHQFLEQIDDLSGMTDTYTYNDIKQMVVDNLVMEFRHALNNVVFGDPAGKEYVEAFENEKSKL